jgi:hypothetical protein
LDGSISNTTSCSKSILKFKRVFISIQELGYANPRLPSSPGYSTKHGTVANLQPSSPGAHACEQTELPLLISRPPISWLVTHKVSCQF